MSTTIQFYPDVVQPLSRPIVFAPNVVEKMKKTFKFDNVEVYDEAQSWMKGWFGHPVLMPMKFETHSYTVQTGKSSYKSTTAEELYLPVALVEISRAKNMEMTAVEGRNGTVKEYGSHGDYMVTIRGILMGELDEGVWDITGRYPWEERQKLEEMEQCPEAVPVAGTLFERLNITSLVIRELRWVPMEGVEEAQAFEMDCVSDAPVELKLKNEQ